MLELTKTADQSMPGVCLPPIQKLAMVKQQSKVLTETLTELSEQDLADNAELLRSNGRSSSGVSVIFESAANPQVIAPDEYIQETDERSQ